MPNSSGDEKGKVVARVYDRFLFENELKAILPEEELSSNDSIVLIQNYINVWAKNQLMLYKAEYNLNEEQKNFEEQIEDYRNDLLKFAYETEYLKQNLDTSISKAEIQEYYRLSSANFLLKENILIADYIIINPNAPNLKDAKKWFKSNKAEERSELKNYALKYAREFYLEDSTWVSFDRIVSKIPLMDSDLNQQRFLSQNNFVEFSDSNRIYLLQIRDYKIRNQQAPLSYLEDLIRNILINKKKLELLANLEKNLLEDALNKKEFETY